LAAQEADLIVLQEANDAWVAAAEVGLPGFRKLTNTRARDDNFGMAMLARDGLGVADVALVWDAAQVPRLEATVDVGGVAVRVLAVHTLPPVSGGYAAGRAAQLVEVADCVNAVGEHVVVIGDLNATPWSAPFRKLMRATGLRNTAVGRGPTGTWPAGMGGWLGIPLDHVLIGPGLGVVSHRVGPALGSDHRAVVADLAVYGAEVAVDPGR